MANQVAARLAGDDYQHLLAWGHLVELLLPGSRLRKVTVEGLYSNSLILLEPAPGVELGTYGLQDRPYTKPALNRLQENY
jgi:hypothetical protein